MGPRSCERGNGDEEGLDRAVMLASMGPRSCERGNVGELAGSLRLPKCFNGAALVRARKYPDGAEVTITKTLASMGPRSCERGNRRRLAV